MAYSQSKLKQPVNLKRQKTLDPTKTEEEKKEELQSIMNKAWKNAEDSKKKKVEKKEKVL